MVQVVFVHGVTVRTDRSYDIGTRLRDDLFRSAAFADAAHLVCVMTTSSRLFE